MSDWSKVTRPIPVPNEWIFWDMGWRSERWPNEIV